MSILIDMTYANWAPDENLDKGYVFKNEAVSFKTLVELMRVYESASTYPANSYSWLSSFNTDFRTGVETVQNLHFSPRNKSRYRKYWGRALKVAGFK